MKKNLDIGEGSKRSSFIGCVLLALLSTAVSISLLILTGWQLGDSLKEKIVMATFGVLAVLGAHLLLAFCRSASVKVRFASSLLWLFCMTYVIFNHASFFISSQQQAGIHRVAGLNQAFSVPEPKRNLTEILADQVKIKTELMSKSQIRCYRGCETLNVKLTNLKATLEMLDAEADGFRRWQAAKDSQDDLKDAIRDDPVTAQLAAWSGMTVTQMGLVRSLLFAVILEGVACLCWYVTFQMRDSSVTQKVTPQVADILEATNDVNIEVTSSTSMTDREVEELAKEVMNGQLNLNVKDVRKRCRCAQKKAAVLTRLIEVRLNSLSQAC